MPEPRVRLRLMSANDFDPEGTERLQQLFNGSIMHGGTIGGA